MYRRHIFLLIVITITLFACSKEPPVTELMYDHLEESVALESDYLKYQAQITELEIQDQDIYDEIVDLPMEQFAEIQSLANEALDLAEQRQEKLELEKDSIHASKAEFLQVESYIGQIEEEEVKQSAQEMYDQMIQRYNLYDKLYESYIKSLNLEQQLYEMIQEEETTNEEVTLHVDEVNSSYEEVLSLNESFNESTVKYNELKKEFYTSANMNIQYDED